MLTNYIKIAFRNLKKNKFFSILNILGLSIGLAISLLLLAYTKYEMSYDSMFPNQADIYRMYMKMTPTYNSENWVNLPNVVGPQVKENVPGVLKFTRMVKHDFGAKASLKIGNETIMEDRLFLTDSSFFSMFHVEFVEGNPNTVFKEKNSVVISESRKKKFFPNGNAINQLIAINQKDTLRVTGVYKDFASNSTLDAEMIYNIMDNWMGKNLSWGNASFETYVQVKAGSDMAQMEKNATALIDKNIPKDEQYYTNFYFQPLSQVHLYSSDFRSGYTSRVGNIKTIHTLLGLSALILLIASINYMNLATARTSKNAKEVGVNKVLGARKSQITLRFYTETALVTFLSFVIGFVLAIVLAPFFKSITGAEFSLTNLFNLEFILWSIVLWLMITVLAGSFPSLYMSRINSLILMNKSVLKNSTVELAKKGLVIFQFIISSVLIISVSVMLYQMNFVKKKNLGYNPQEVISVPIKSINTMEKLQSIMGLVNQLPGTLASTPVQSMPGDNESGKTTYREIGDKTGLSTTTSSTFGPITKTLGLTLLAGQDLPANLSKTDTNTYVLINEVVLKFLGYTEPQEAIGKKILTEMNKQSIIRGVVQNFNFQSLKESIGGYSYYTMNGPSESVRELLVRFNTNDLPGYLQKLEALFKRELPDAAYDFTFVDSHVQSLYISENRSSQIIMIFSFLTIFIACLGLIGLAGFTTEQRSKEIGVRKVLGANVFNITGLLSGSFLKLVCIAFLIAAPIAWYIMNAWLAGFTYRVQIPWWSFALAAAISILITALAVGYQTVKAALANPVNSLRDE